VDIKDFLSPDDCMVDVPATDKTPLLKALSLRAASALKLDAEMILTEILKRESLGSTGMGDGTAIPHARIDGLSRCYGILVRLKKPIAFEAIDEQPVNIVFFLLLPTVPEAQQLNTLACVARKFRAADTLRNLRNAPDGAALYRAIVA
jgi:PTS system nitrogen regulatory IIA component